MKGRENGKDNEKGSREGWFVREETGEERRGKRT